VTQIIRAVARPSPSQLTMKLTPLKRRVVRQSHISQACVKRGLFECPVNRQAALIALRSPPPGAALGSPTI